MALHRLQQITIGVPDTDTLNAFYEEIGFTGTSNSGAANGATNATAGSWGTHDRPDQIKLVEAPYRQLRMMHLACEDEADLKAAATRLDAIGVSYNLSQGKLTVIDPINKWQYVMTPEPVNDVALHDKRLMNFPGERPRVNQRAEILVESAPRKPRRIGHVVAGSPDPKKTVELCIALGFRISDSIGGGMAVFMRCSNDHHNFLVTPGPVPYLNHYAIEHDDFDSVFRAASLYIRSRDEEHSIAGPGRHQIGGNIFWYMLDPAGNFFEFFADMDQIVDDAAWTIKDDWDHTDSWSIWGEQKQPEVFFVPKDMPTIIQGWEASQ
ncbi:MAG: catechol 2,3-dioxygenase-like lactoylglutathione lyase family enzyme [Candidatus Azotimanducaceae bacterium]|jgi:catechol 2,3-dioxygenase-like lactoylglutathione lyase family enzyme